MARAWAAGAPAQSDSIKKLAQSIARPAYGRLTLAEPLLRRAVPVLIVAFLFTIFVGALVQILDQRRHALAAAERAQIALADFIAHRIVETGGEDVSPQARLDAALPHWAAVSGQSIQLMDAAGRVLAASARGPSLDAVDMASGLPAFDESLRGGQASAQLVVTRDVAGESLLVRVARNETAALAQWRADAMLLLTLSATTAFVVLILGFAFHWQSVRARETDQINDVVRARIDTALNRGRCGLWDWDLARGRVFWSESMFAILGMTGRGGLLTFGEIRALLHPSDIDLYALAGELASGESTVIDRAFRMRHAEGQWVWLRVRCELTYPTDSADPHLIGIAVDVTEQHRTAEASAAADLRLRDAIEALPEAFVVWDSANRLVVCNSHFQKLHGLPDRAAIHGAAYDDVLALCRTPQMHRRDAGIAAADGRTFEAQTENGTWLHVSERRTRDGGYVSVGTDITDIKRHEQALVESERRLIATVDDLKLSRAILERQAIQLAELATKYAEEKNRAEDASQTKSKFLATMSHELRTPLNAIIGFSEVMESEMFGPLGVDRYGEYARDIRESGQYLLNVINDVLDMSKIEAGRLPLYMETLDLERTLSDSLRVVEGQAGDKQLRIRADIAPDVLFAADARAIKQITLNLMSNAVKFTAQGGCVTVRGRAAGGSVFITIADSGIGIEREALRRLGRPFEQIESQLTRTHRGSGLGLAISKSLAELHGGTIRILSAPGRGTVVSVRLPQSVRARRESAEPAAPEAMRLAG